MRTIFASAVLASAVLAAQVAAANPTPPLHGFTKVQGVAVMYTTCSYDGTLTRCWFIAGYDYANGLGHYAFTNIAVQVDVYNFATGAQSQRYISCGVPQGTVSADRSGGSLSAVLDPASPTCFTGGSDYDPVNGWTYGGYTSPVEVTAQVQDARVKAENTQVTKYEIASIGYTEHQQCRNGNNTEANIVFSIAGEVAQSQLGAWNWGSCIVVAKP